MNAFYPKYHIRLITDILDVMTDGFHKSGLEAQSKIFYLLIQVAKSNIVLIPLCRSNILYPKINPQANQTQSFCTTSS